MSKTTGGFAMIGAGVLLWIIGQAFVESMEDSGSALMTNLSTVTTIAAATLFAFGLLRLLSELFRSNRDIVVRPGLPATGADVPPVPPIPLPGGINPRNKNGAAKSMSKMRSGVIFLVAGIGMNLLGRAIAPFAHPDTGTVSTLQLIMVGAMLVWMLASAVMAIFGLYRIVAGMVVEKRTAK